MDKEDKRKRLLIIILIILLLLMMLASFAISNPIPIGEPDDPIIDPVPTPSVDPVIKDNDENDIIIDYKPELNNKENETVEKAVFVFEQGSTKWESVDELKIFDYYEESFAASGKIAPGLKSKYAFTIKNTNSFSVRIKLDFIETNEDNLDLVYRLKLDNQYIVGNDSNYVEPEILKTTIDRLPSKSQLDFILEWYMLEDNDEHDTNLGISASSEYKLDINVLAEEIE